MAKTRKVTFTLPAELADLLNRQVRSLDRSAFVSAAIAERMDAKRRRLIASCEAANANPEDAELREEMAALEDDGLAAHAPWNAQAFVKRDLAN